LALHPSGRWQAVAYIESLHAVHELAPLLAHRLSLRAHAIAQGVGIGSALQTTLAPLQDGDAGLAVLQGKPPLLREDLCPLLRGQTPPLPTLGERSHRLG
jgi:hypothetical protein